MTGGYDLSTGLVAGYSSSPGDTNSVRMSLDGQDAAMVMARDA